MNCVTRNQLTNPVISHIVCTCDSNERMNFESHSALFKIICVINIMDICCRCAG